MSSVRSASSRLLLAACVAAAASSFATLPAHAADAAKPKKEGSLGQAKAGAPMLTKEQLRACLAQKDRIKSQITETVPLQTALKKEGDDLAREGDDLKALREKVDTTNEAAVKEFNDRNVARQKAVESYEARSKDYNAKVEAVLADKAAYQSSCDGKRYFEDEELQIRKEK